MAERTGPVVPASPRFEPAMKVHDALAAATHFLALTDAEGAGGDARRLLSHVLGCTTLDLITRPDRALDAAQCGAYAHALERRAGGEPVSRITGRRGFYGREFLVTPATLIRYCSSFFGPSSPQNASFDQNPFSALSGASAST